MTRPWRLLCHGLLVGHGCGFLWSPSCTYPPFRIFDPKGIPLNGGDSCARGDRKKSVGLSYDSLSEKQVLEIYPPQRWTCFSRSESQGRDRPTAASSILWWGPGTYRWRLLVSVSCLPTLCHWSPGSVTQSPPQDKKMPDVCFHMIYPSPHRPSSTGFQGNGGEVRG